jgi:hypothetical protein
MSEEKSSDQGWQKNNVFDAKSWCMIRKNSEEYRYYDHKPSYDSSFGGMGPNLKNMYIDGC